MELETINKLYLELSQVATAKTAREAELEDVLESARCIAQRNGEGTDWSTFNQRIARLGIGSTTPRVFKVPSDAPYGLCPTCQAPGKARERRIGGNDICVNGHKYPSTSAL